MPYFLHSSVHLISQALMNSIQFARKVVHETPHSVFFYVAVLIDAPASPAWAQMQVLFLHQC